MTIKYYYDLIQGSPEWEKARIGLLCASEFINILTPTLKIAENDDSRSHVFEILAQRISNYVEPSYTSDDMLRGSFDESEARELYRKNYQEGKECGFITNDKLGFLIGFSPDFLVGDDGLIEVKSRKQSIHIKNIMEDIAEKKTMIQIQVGLFVSERKWCDFISYSGGLPMFVKRVEVDDKYQEAIKQSAIGFENRVNQLMQEYKTKIDGLIPTERKIYGEIN